MDKKQIDKFTGKIPKWEKTINTITLLGLLWGTVVTLEALILLIYR